jgi:hypothetical protein
VKAIGAGIGATVCFFYLGCGSVQVAEASHSTSTSPLTIVTSIMPSAIVGTPYVEALDASGGTPAYSWSITSGSLPSGLTLTPSTGIITGTPKVGGKFSVDIAVTDSSSPSQKKSTALTISVAAPPLSIPALTLPSVTAGTSYSQSLQATGGTAPYTWSISSGRLPAGLTLTPSTGIISGTPTASGTASFTATVRDSESPAKSASLATSIVVDATSLKIGTLTLPSVTVGTAYSQTLQATGGTAPYTWSISSGVLPAGLSLASSTGVISGTPRTSGVATITASVKDSGSPAQSTSASMSITVAATALSIVASALPSVTVGTAYSQMLKATGGTTPYTWSITSGKLPAGLTLTSSTGTISGTPTTSGTSTFTATVTDRSSPVQSASTTGSVVVSATALSIVPSTLPSVTVGTTYSQTLKATGGTKPYTWSITSGNLPAGLTLASAAGTISGTPTTSGTSTFTATVTDSSSPTKSASTTGSVVVSATALSIVASTLPSVTVGTAYSQTLKATGGTTPYTWSITSGKLPAGLTLASSTGVISGTPTTSGTSTFTATVTDSSSPVQSASTPGSVVVSPTALAITAPTLPSGTVGTAYAQTLQATGGTAPYKWAITSGSLPTGLTLASTTGAISGAPTASGTFAFTATVTDSSSPTLSASTSASVLVTPTLLAITSSTLPSVVVGSSYSHALQASGGTAPYSWAIKSGRLPAGLTLTPATGTITGVPTATGTVTFTAMVTDSSGPAQTTSATTAVVVAPSTSTATTPPLTIMSSSQLSLTVGTAYVQTLQATGGTSPYSWAITSGELPAGLSFSSATGTISGTPTRSGSSSLTITLSDSSSPVESQSASVTIVIAAAAQNTATALAITSSSLASATVGTAYTQTLQASGGTPAYTWSISSGSLPSGLTLAGTTGVISGTPTSNGTSSFTATVSDNGNPVQTQSLATSITTAAASLATTGPGTTWYIRADGGTRYDAANAPSGQCTGLADAAYPGKGVAQACAFNQVPYLWDAGQSLPVAPAWIISGGDTVVIRGCAGASSPACRLGWSAPTGDTNIWCMDVGNNGCYNPPIPAGTSLAHTKILGGCAYGSYTCNPVNTYPYTSNLTQLFAGYGLSWAINLETTSYVDVEGIELTTHNAVSAGNPGYPSQCTTGIGNPYPQACQTGSQPYDDYGNTGFLTNYQSANITFQDVYVHGFDASGFQGEIGGPITMTRVFSGFNAFAGWNFTGPAGDVADAPGSSITANYVWMYGNGCSEQYPIVNTSFPAKGCWDSGTGGFGDGWSGQDTELDSFVCHHCVMYYNTKDAFIGPHTQIANLDIQDSVSVGSMGAEWKWAATTNSTVLFQNNLTVTNCTRLEEIIPGAAYNFEQTNGNPGAHLATYCRGGGAGFAFITRSGSVNHFYGNTVIGASTIIFQENCGYYVPGNIFNQETNCGSVPNIFTGNNFLGYVDANQGTDPPALYYAETPSINFTGSYNNEFGLKGGTTDSCGTNNVTCIDPLMVNEPVQPWPGSEAALDAFNPFNTGNSFYLAPGSPLVQSGASLTGMATDYYGLARQNPPSIGAVEP